MEQFIGQELKDSIQSFQVKQGISKEGNPYNYIEMVLCNGYSNRLFLTEDKRFAFQNAFETYRTSKQMEL